MATFVITKRLNGFYKYELLSRKAKPIFTSNDFELRFECEEEIEFLKRHVEEIIFMRFRSGNGKYFFRVILKDKEIAKSRKYSTSLLLQKGIEEVIKYVASAETLDFSGGIDWFDAI